MNTNTYLTLGVRRRGLPVLGLLVALTSLAACDLTVPDPNATTNEDAYQTRAGLIASTVGLQLQYNATAYQTLVLTTGITSRELAADFTFANLLELDAGGAALDPSNANLTGYFREMIQTISTASAIIEGAQTTETVEPELQSGIVALAEFYKAASVGALAIGFTDVVVDPTQEGSATYLSREDAFQEAADLLASAEDRLTATPPNSAFTNTLPDGFDLLNSVRAYRARFELFAGNLDEALAAAGRVAPEATSVFAYSGTVQNPLYQAIEPSIQSQPSFAVRDNLGLENVEANDGRIDYFTEDNPDTSVNGYPIETATGFIVGGNDGPLPVYVPDEMRLIEAEVYARTNRPGLAVEAINAVRTDEEDPFGLAANLPEYDGATTETALLDEIFYNRATELYLQGLRLEDARRLNQGEPDPSDSFQRTRNFYPFPQQERLASPDTTPADPAI